MSSRQCRGGSGSSPAAVVITTVVPQIVQRNSTSTGRSCAGSGSGSGSTLNFRSNAPR